MFGRVSSLSDSWALSHKVGGMMTSKLVTAYLETISKIMTYTRSKFWTILDESCIQQFCVTNVSNIDFEVGVGWMGKHFDYYYSGSFVHKEHNF